MISFLLERGKNQKRGIEHERHEKNSGSSGGYGASRRGQRKCGRGRSDVCPEGITVTATRQAESLKDVPANVQVITEKDIKLRNVQTASDAVAMATGVSASNSVEGTVNLRGYSSKNILVLVDGQQMNTAWNGDVDWNMILSRISVRSRLFPAVSPLSTAVVRSAASSIS